MLLDHPVLTARLTSSVTGLGLGVEEIGETHFAAGFGSGVDHQQRVGALRCVAGLVDRDDLGRRRNRLSPKIRRNTRSL